MLLKFIKNGARDILFGEGSYRAVCMFYFCEIIITLYVNTCIGEKIGYKPLLVTFGLGILGARIY